ncbi:cytochrome P450 [Crassisporium funariophilum]|nr:cytochrome P450 [Crassisporium funariophilum]
MDAVLSVLYIASFLLLLLATAKVVQGLICRVPRGAYPPGPKPTILIGNLFDFPTSNVAEEYTQWSERYGGSIVHASALGNHVVVINKLEDADELFQRRSQKYSDRPNVPILGLMGWDYNFGLLSYGEEWRYHRKICQQNFRLEAASSYHPTIIRKVHELLQGLLLTPHNFNYHNRMLSISIPMSTMYGYDVKSINDPLIVVAEESLTLGGDLLIPGATFINILPFLRHIPAYFPFATSHKRAAEVRRVTEDMVRMPMEFAKRRMMDGTAVPSLVSNFLEKKMTSNATEEEELAIGRIASTVYGAGSDTIKSSTGTFLYAMAINPDIQRKAQAEIDRVVGFSRLPGFEDRASMPYVEAIYREVMRWKPPGKLGVPHSLSEDDHYNGYFIPKGLSAMTHDENVYKNPFKFNPDRFFDQNGQLNDDNRILAYGFGRRVCVGKHVASATVWLAIVSVLATFDITKAKDKLGNDIEINDEYIDFGLLSHKKPFECSFTPRSAVSCQLVEDTMEKS